jgi:RNA binding exosome subunit
MNRLYCEAYIQKALSQGSWETDQHGNPIVIIEASNDNLDFQQEKILQEALLNSKDYFLQNGVISYDHKHKPFVGMLDYDPEWNEEKYIIGKPLDVWLNDKTVTVKAVLYNTVDRAKEIIKKLKAGAETVKASVGGRLAKKKKIFDTDVMKNIDNIISVFWDEVALTYKPVNQTLGPTILSPAEFVKSLTAGSSANPAEMTGGNSLQVQSIEGKKVLDALMESIKNNEIDDKDQIREYLLSEGISVSDTDKIVKLLAKNINRGEKSMSEEKDTTSQETPETTDELLKALDEFESNIQKQEELQKAKKEPEPEKDEDEEGEEYEDVTDDVQKMKKSMEIMASENKELTAMVKSLSDTVKEQGKLLVAIGKQSAELGEMTKSISGMPADRKSQLDIHQRFEKSLGDSKLAKMNKFQIQQLGYKAVKNGAPSRIVNDIMWKFQKSFDPKVALMSLNQETVSYLEQEAK